MADEIDEVEIIMSLHGAVLDGIHDSKGLRFAVSELVHERDELRRTLDAMTGLGDRQIETIRARQDVRRKEASSRCGSDCFDCVAFDITGKDIDVLLSRFYEMREILRIEREFRQNREAF